MLNPPAILSSLPASQVWRPVNINTIQKRQSVYHRSQPTPECGCHTFNQDASCWTLIQGNPCIEVLTKRLISNIYIKVHWHGTTEKPKVRNGAGLFKYKSTHCIYLISLLIWGLSGTLIYHCHTGRPVPCIAHTTNNLMMARLFSGEDRTSQSCWFIPLAWGC